MAGIKSKLNRAANVSVLEKLKGLDIEGMSFDKTKDRLLIGLRAPVIDGKAMIAVLENPQAAFTAKAPPKFADTPILLDLDRGGIRAMTYDPRLGGYLIISRQQKKGKKVKLWLWSGHPGERPARIRVPGALDLSNAEGITPIRHKGAEWLMVVFDIGKRSKRKNGCYAFLSYDQITVEPVD